MAAYGIIVIGADIAGLTTAPYLAKGGARILVCEQAAQVGECFNSFWRDGYLRSYPKGRVKTLQRGDALENARSAFL